MIPRDGRLQQLRMLAQIADQDLLLPPSRLLEPAPQAEPLMEWAEKLNLSSINGLIVSLETITAGTAPEKLPQQLSPLRQARKKHPQLPIYGFATLDSANASQQLCRAALDLVADGTLNYLLIAQAEGLNAKPAQIARARLIGEAASRRLEDRVAFDDSTAAAAATLLARLIAGRYSQTPKILSVYSSKEGSQVKESRNPIELERSVAAKIKIAGGAAPTTAEAAAGADIALFVHTPQTNPETRLVFAKAASQAIEKGVRVALVDLSENKTGKDAVLAELRGQKQLDRLLSYASSNLSDEAETREAVNRALAQAVLHFTAMKSLRTDADRVLRIDRAQVTLLFSRYLQDWGYNLIVLPKLDEYVQKQLKAAPDNLGQNIEAAEKFAFEQLQPIADELFEEQFRRNSHVILLNNGARAQFRISLLQRLLVRLDSGKTTEAEIKQSIHTFYEGRLLPTK
ncbi:MAG TPA: DUF4127 family protein [Blastocatellia bacterium]|nr:DUF4127 family protein [Blastocatellia bacterium]HMV87421.1 DUF4127 family protein [Blastocatellia bacterium]HMX25351.1 DUF4127 family protein [Blastocatellia bacterium]HMY73168.1 DUF4127 family protein [Blastocatellia bacterium]HMZ16656.1 DUF4127 family protein [Blastocatellia bacterium]